MKYLGFIILIIQSFAAGELVHEARQPKSEADAQYWAANMRRHGFTESEMEAAGIVGKKFAPLVGPTSRLEVLPYPGVRHPRLGFLEGAINPQRETKFSVFTPWDSNSYVVADVPEAMFSNLGLTYLAHTHVPTIWSAQGIKLPPLEWNRQKDGRLEITRELPNRIAFGAKIIPHKDHVAMELWLRNGTGKTLTGLRVQNCVMLGYAKGFEAQTNSNKIFQQPFVAVRSQEGNRWIITAWEPCQRTWANPPVPCLHSDPQFPDCPPGETKRVRGWLSFYEGKEIEKEFARISRLAFPKQEK